MKQHIVVEKIMRILVQQDLVQMDDCDTVAPFIGQAWAAGYESGRKLRKTGKEVVQLSLDGNKICIHETAFMASRRVGSHPDNIRKAARGLAHTCKGYKWKYLDQYNNHK